MDEGDYEWAGDGRYASGTLVQQITSAMATLTATIPDDDTGLPLNIRPSMRISHGEMLALDNEDKKTMMRQRIVSDDITKELLNWCEVNCTDLWSRYDDAISFMSKEDMTLFMITFRGS